MINIILISTEGGRDLFLGPLLLFSQKLRKTFDLFNIDSNVTSSTWLKITSVPFLFSFCILNTKVVFYRGPMVESLISQGRVFYNLMIKFLHHQLWSQNQQSRGHYLNDKSPMLHKTHVVVSAWPGFKCSKI